MPLKPSDPARAERLRVGRLWKEIRESTDDPRYLILLIVLALAGQLFASYDFNLLVLAEPDIQKSLHLSSTALGSLLFIIYAGEFLVTLTAGYMMDRAGRKRIWQLNLLGTALFTGLTYFVDSYWSLIVVRTIASAFAVAEFAMAATLVSEQAPARVRGFLYSIVNGGYAWGLLLAAAVYSIFDPILGWHLVFALGAIPILVLVWARRNLRESDRWLHVKEIKDKLRAGRRDEVDDLLERYDVDIEEVQQPTTAQLIRTPGPVRRRLLLLTVIWLFYAASFAGSNAYITFWLTHVAHWASDQAAILLLVAGGIGFFFYVLGGLLGERFGRKEAMLMAGVLVGPLGLLFLWESVISHGWTWYVFVTWFFLYQATNGVWSGAGQGYWPEAFPTRVRGTAVGWLGSMFALGLLIGAGIWTAMIGSVGPIVTWLVVVVVIGFGEYLAFLLPHIEPNQALEDIAR